MGGLFSSPKPPKQPKRVKPDPILPNAEDFGSQEAARRARLAAMQRRGRASTVLTQGGSGLAASQTSVPALTYVNTLLGR